MTALHPRAALFDPGEPAATQLPVCDHYCGVEARMRKSLELQAELGPVFDVTLDAEDGAPIGGEVEHALLIAATAIDSGASVRACCRSITRVSTRSSRSSCSRPRHPPT
jgi:citrate lyase subunit beta / citryl-CoA lyase